MDNSLQVLFIEDQEDDALLAVRVLKQNGYNPTWMRVDTEAALRDALQQSSWDVILSDHALPGFSGSAALNVLKELGIDTPFILLSGAIGEEAAVAIIRAGARDFVPKSNLLRLPLVIDRELREAEARRERRRTELALQQSQERYRRIVETANEGIWVVDEQDCTTFINPTMATMLKYTPEEMLGKTIDAFMFPEDREDHFRKMAWRRQGHPDCYERRFHTRDGSERWMEISATPLMDAEGHFTGSFAMLTDITARKKAEAALRESEERLRTLINAMPDIICFKDAEGRWLEANDFDLQLFQLEGVAYRGRTDAELAQFSPFYRDALLTCEASDAGAWAAKAPTRGDEVIPRPDGTTRVFDIIKVPTFHPDGRRKGLVVVGRDITDRKRVEEERAHQARRIRQLIDSVPEGVLLLDTDGRVTLANPRGVKKLAALSGIAVGERLTQLGGYPLKQFLTSPPRGKWHELTANGRHYEIIARPIYQVSGIEDWVMVIRDVTERHEMEFRAQQQERLAALGQLAAGIAHDFNNILAVITLYTRMELLANDTSPRLRERLEIIHQQAWRASDLIQQILDFSRRAVLEKSTLDLLPFLKELLKLLQTALPEHIKLSLRYDEGEYLIHADPTRLQQVFMNLATNARDAMPTGGLLHFDLEWLYIPPGEPLPLSEMRADDSASAPLPRTWLRITVSDTGIGIPPEHLPQIFNPFFTTKDPGKGTGLGLAQVFGVVKLHAGYLDVISTVGQGTSVILYLPALQLPIKMAVAPPMPQLQPGSGQTLLVVEDDAVLRWALVENLRHLNYRVLEAEDGEQALVCFREHRAEIALVLSDMVMPRMGGLALLQALRREAPQVKFLLLTGHPLDQELRDAEAIGLSGYLLKPPDLDALALLLAETLEKPAP